MNLKKKINFKMLQEYGPSLLDVKNNDVIEFIAPQAQKSELMVVVTQEHYLELLAVYNDVLIRNGLKEEKLVNIAEKIPELEKEMDEIIKLSQEI